MAILRTSAERKPQQQLGMRITKQSRKYRSGFIALFAVFMVDAYTRNNKNIVCDLFSSVSCRNIAVLVLDENSW